MIEDLKISVVIPAKNEVLTIRSIIEEVKKHAFEVLVINGNSKDATKKIAEEKKVKVFQDTGKGKGEAVRLGIDNSYYFIIYINMRFYKK